MDSSLKLLIRTRNDLQAIRIGSENRLGRKADGSAQSIDERILSEDTYNYFNAFSDYIKDEESKIEKMLKKELKKHRIYNEFLADVKGVGTVVAAWILSEFDIHKATTVSKLWQFSGLNPGLVIGKKRVEQGDTYMYVPTDTLVRGDKQTAGFVRPYNSKLRSVLIGILASGFIKAKSPYALNYYYPYKERLLNEESIIEGGKKDEKWSEVSLGHRDNAAKRYMIKMFLKDLYVAWRTIEGLSVRPPYKEEYLGKKHQVA